MTQQFLLRSRGRHAARFEAVPMAHCSLSLLMTRSTMPFCCGQCGVIKLLAQAVTAYQCRLATTRKSEAIVRPQQERLRKTAQGAEAGDQCVL